MFKFVFLQGFLQILIKQIIYNNTVWFLQVFAPGSNAVGESELTLQFYMSI